MSLCFYRALARQSDRLGAATDREKIRALLRHLRRAPFRYSLDTPELHGRAPLSVFLFEARAGHDTRERLPGLTMPVYLCGGLHDGIAPPANMRALEEQIPGATLDLFEGGHLFLVQDPAAFPRILAFLAADR